MIGETISHYRVVSEIGAGGMGVVYKAEDLRLGRFVALKFLPQAVIRESDEKRRFFSEARASSALDHPNVCTIYDVEDLPDGRVFLAMAFCDGETLKQRLGRGPISPIDATRFAAQVASGLARAHHAGIVHRDVKPANIMVTTQGDVKLLDFGIAKLVGSDMTRTGTILGTIAYMSPEQARGAHVDERSDVWALGVTMYEMLAGNRPFTGADDLALLRAIAEAPVPPLAVAGVSPELAGVVARALDRDTSRRYANAGEMAAALDPLLHHAGTDEHAAYLAGGSTRRRFPGWAVAAVTAVAVAIGVAGVWAWRSGNARGARSIELAEVLRLADQDRNGEAFVLAAEAARVRAGDPLLESAWPRISQTVSVTTTPPGADVSFRLIGGDGVWHPLGRTPLKDVRAPKGIFEWRLEKAGWEALDLVLPNLGGPPGAGIDGAWSLAEPGTLPPGMVSVPVPPAGIRLTLTGFDYNFPTVAPSYFLDQHEVTNAEFQDFVEAGGYEERRYWTEPFVRDGRPMDWATAMTLFRDRTGRPGPATWVGGAPPAGQETIAVAGVSSYEAAAYAAFRGKRLPTIHHWSHAAQPPLGDAITRTSNFGGAGPRPAQSPRGLGPFGTLDMAGNVKEWVWNDTGGGTRYVLGGAWNDPEYMFLFLDSRSPFDRSETVGFRCMKDGEAPTPAALTAAIAVPSRDYSAERPVGDNVYPIYAKQYDYDHTPLEAHLDASDDTSPYWRHELVSIAAAYGGERLPIHLYLPKNVKPPFETVLYFPGSNAMQTQRSVNLVGPTSRHSLDFLPQSGRALAFPVYKYTFERGDPKVVSSWAAPTRAYTTWVQQIVLDVRRTLDYLQSRPEFDSGRIAYFGTSWGARMAPIPIAVDRRIKAAVLLMGGLGSTMAAPEADPFNFAPRVHIPVLMLNGNQDFIFPLQTMQLGLFNVLGTPTTDKRHVLYPGGHEIYLTKRSQIAPEVLAWLDKYLGPVR